MCTLEYREQKLVVDPEFAKFLWLQKVGPISAVWRPACYAKATGGCT
jgi:hypothetical protein